MKKKIRRLINRNGNTLCDICKTESVLEGHHINGREIERANDPFNIANICPNCHYKVHLGRIIIEGWFDTTDGRLLLWHNKEEQTVTNSQSNPFIIK